MLTTNLLLPYQLTLAICPDPFLFIQSGDCCPTTCKKKTGVMGSCMLTKMDCRSPDAAKDTIPPILVGVPRTADLKPSTPLLIPYSRLYISAGQPQMVSAQDNFPCFNPSVRIRDVNLTAPAAPARTCVSRIVYFVRRNWTTTDMAGLTASASQVLSVFDDQAPVAGAATRITLSRSQLAKSKQKVVVKLGITPQLPNKSYRWRLTAPPSPKGPTVIKQGEI